MPNHVDQPDVRPELLQKPGSLACLLLCRDVTVGKWVSIKALPLAPYTESLVLPSAEGYGFDYSRGDDPVGLMSAFLISSLC